MMLHDELFRIMIAYFLGAINECEFTDVAWYDFSWIKNYGTLDTPVLAER